MRYFMVCAIDGSIRCALGTHSDSVRPNVEASDDQVIEVVATDFASVGGFAPDQLALKMWNGTAIADKLLPASRPFVSGAGMSQESS